MSQRNGKIPCHLIPPAIRWGDEERGDRMSEKKEDDLRDLKPSDIIGPEGEEDDEPGDDSTIEERVDEFGRTLRRLAREIRGAGIEKEGNVVSLILCFFDQELAQ